MKGTTKRVSSLEARMNIDRPDPWAYFEEPVYLTMSVADQAAISEILQKVDQAYTESIQAALSDLSDAELDTLEAFVLNCRLIEEDGGL